MMSIMVDRNHPSSVNFDVGAPSIADVSNSDTVTQVAIPALDSLYAALADTPEQHLSSKVPVNHGAMQVGFRGRPESYEDMDVAIHGGDLRVRNSRQSRLEGPFIDTSGGKRSIGRVVIGPFSSIDVVKTDVNGVWHVIPRDKNGQPVVVPTGGRVMLARTLAKLADVTQGKIKRTNRAA